MTRHNEPGKPLKRRPLIPQRKLTNFLLQRQQGLPLLHRREPFVLRPTLQVGHGSRTHPTSPFLRQVAPGFGDWAGTVKVNKLITKSVTLGQQTIGNHSSEFNESFPIKHTMRDL